MTDKNLLLKIEAEYASFSKGQKAIADYISSNYDKAAYMTAGALGRTVGVSESTVVRFACVLGYEGYPKLQNHLQELIKNKLTIVQRLNLMDGLPPDKIVDTVLKTDIANLKTTRENLDINVFERVVDLITNARKLYIIGYRSSAPLCRFLAYYLSYIIEPPHVLSGETSDIHTQLVHISEKDVIIGVGFPRYSTQTVRGLEFAKNRGAKVVAITDNIASPLHSYADECILTKSHMNSFVDSLVAPLSMINSLIIMIGLKKQDVLLENFSVMEEAWRENDVYTKQDMVFSGTEFEEYE